MMPGMDHTQEHELRQWAEALRASADSERRAMGRALSMLLDRIGELEHQLGRRDAVELEPHPLGEEVWADPEMGGVTQPGAGVSPLTFAETEDEALDDELSEAPKTYSSLEDTQPLGLRDRLRAAAERLTDR